MFKSNTTFIVGAGASQELNFPLGTKFKKDIAKRLDIRVEMFNTFVSGDRSIIQALRQHVDNQKEEDVEEFNSHLQAARHISEVIEQSISIDNLVENLSDERVTRMAKLAIASSIIEAERVSKLSPKEPASIEPNWHPLNEVYLNYLFQLIVESTNKNNLMDTFKNINFIIFNYDRVIEHYFYLIIQRYFGIPETEARDLVDSINFIHPYGQVGYLPWFEGDGTKHQYADPNNQRLFDISNSIRTFSERIEDPEFSRRVGEILAESDSLVFLGFGFHEANMSLLKPANIERVKRIVATGYGLSEPDMNVVKTQLRRIYGDIAGNKNLNEIVIDRNATCSALLADYGRLLRS